MAKLMLLVRFSAMFATGRLVRGFAVFVFFSCATANAATVALLVGSSAYTNEPLGPASRAVGELATTLSQLGVSVHHLTDPTRVSLERSVDAFATEAAEADVALIAYVGHGLRLGGRAFLVPTEITLRSRSDLKYLVPLQQLIDAASGAKSHVAVLDTCHSSSLAAGWGDKQYQREPLCVSSTPGFDLAPAAGLVWAARNPSDADDRSGVGRLVLQLARSSSLKDLDLGKALSAAADSNVVFSGVPASLVMPINEDQSARQQVSAVDDSRARRSVLKTARLAPGLYGISDFRGSRWISQSGARSLSLTSEPDYTWQLDTADGDAFTIINRLSDLPLRLSRRSAESSTWQLVQAEDGQKNEYQLRSTITGRWLVSRGGSLAMEDTAGITGWLFDKATEEQGKARVALAKARVIQESAAQTESQQPGQGLDEPIAGSVQNSTISDSVRDAVVSTFRQVSEAIESNNIAELQNLLPAGDSRDLLLFLVAAYREVDAEVTDIQDSDDRRIISASVRIVSLEEPLPGIKALRSGAPAVVMHRERVGANSDSWSAIRFGSGG